MHEPRPGFSAVLILAMAGSTFALAIIAVLAADLIEEFDISRGQLGALVTSASLTGALLSPVLGPWSDRIGARNATLFSLVVSAASLLAMGLAPTFLLLMVGTLLSGVTQGITNPATNKLISLYVDRGRRGVIMGVKQSGVQAGNAIGGVVLPPIAVAAGWRFGVVGAIAVPLLGIGLALWSIPRDRWTSPGGGVGPPPGSPGVGRLALYGFLLGSGGSAVFTYLPLFAQEALGASPVVAGATVSVIGIVGVAARIGWGRLAELVVGSDRSLFVIGVMSVLVGVLLVFAEVIGVWVLWPISALAGMSVAAWNSVGMLAVIDRFPVEAAGKASGTVMLGFLGGLGAAAPVFGRSVDVLGSYRPGWVGVTVAFVLASMLWWRPARRQHEGRTETGTQGAFPSR